MPDPTSPIPPAEFGVLLVLLDGPKHGHGIKLDIRHRTGGRVDMGPGPLYGAITRLVRRGWLVEVDGPGGDTDDRKRFYTLTAHGRTAAAGEAGRMEELLDIARAKNLRPAEGS